MLKTYKRRYSSLKFRNFADVCQPRPQGAFPWLLPTSKAREKRPGDEVGRLQMVRSTNFHKLAGLHLRSLTAYSFQNWQVYKALFQVVSVNFPFTWSRSTGRGRVSTLSVPGFHMQGHCNTRKIYTF